MNRQVPKLTDLDNKIPLKELVKLIEDRSLKTNLTIKSASPP